MIAGLRSRFASPLACLLLVATAPAVMAQAGNCSDIANDVRVAIEKDPTKVLMVVEDALVINEGCAGDIVKAAIVASKADASLANQIVQTATTVAPKQMVAINEAAAAIVPGVAVASTALTASSEKPVTITSEKNPGKNPVLNSPDPEDTTLDSPDPFFTPTPRGVFLIQAPVVSTPNPPTGPNPLSPSVLR